MVKVLFAVIGTRNIQRRHRIYQVWYLTGNKWNHDDVTISRMNEVLE